MKIFSFYIILVILINYISIRLTNKTRSKISETTQKVRNILNKIPQEKKKKEEVDNKYMSEYASNPNQNTNPDEGKFNKSTTPNSNINKTLIDLGLYRFVDFIKKNN